MATAGDTTTAADLAKYEQCIKDISAAMPDEQSAAEIAKGLPTVLSITQQAGGS